MAAAVTLDSLISVTREIARSRCRHTEMRTEQCMSDNDGDPNSKRHTSWNEVKRRFEIEFFARTNGITKRQAAELFRKYGEKDYETMVREARWLRE